MNHQPSKRSEDFPAQKETVAIDPSGQLSDLVAYLDERRDAILLAWRAAVEADERLEVVSQLGRREFEDSIPVWLDLLSQQLRHDIPASHGASTTEAPIEDNFFEYDEAGQHARELIQEHGSHRWRQGYDLRQVMLEWGHLNQTMVQVLNEYQAAHPIPVLEMARARVLAAQLLDVGYVHTVCEYHRLQQAEAKEIVHSLSEALDQVAQWEQTRGQALREAVHDLRGTLSAVHGAATLLEDVSGAKADLQTQKSVFNVLQGGTQALQRMLTELLDLARLEAGQEDRVLGNFDAAALVRELCESVEPLAHNRGLWLRFSGPPSILVEGDSMKVRRIIQNLLLNALKYTDQGGVTVTWAQTEPDAWGVSVEDTGPGLSSPREPTAHAARGEGVGLAIVKRLCTLLDARLEVESAHGTGTTFHVTWPSRYSTP